MHIIPNTSDVVGYSPCMAFKYVNDVARTWLEVELMHCIEFVIVMCTHTRVDACRRAILQTRLLCTQYQVHIRYCYCAHMAWSSCAASILQSSCTYNIEHVFEVVKYSSGMALNTHSLLRAHGLRAMRSIELAIVRAWLRDHALYRVRYHQMYTIASTHSTSFERKRLSLRQ